jgi:anthranilate phosphoribosyltransferase
MIVHGADGLDEISIIGKTLIAWLKNGEIHQLEITPKEFGFRTAKSSEIILSTSEENIILAFKLLTNKMPIKDPKLNMILLNSAGGIIVGGKANNFEEGIEIAIESIKSGRAYKKLKTLIKTSGGNLHKLEELEERFD